MVELQRNMCKQAGRLGGWVGGWVKAPALTAGSKQEGQRGCPVRVVRLRTAAPFVSASFCRLFINPVNPQHIPGCHRCREREERELHLTHVYPLCLCVQLHPELSGSEMTLFTCSLLKKSETVFCPDLEVHEKLFYSFSPPS